MIEDVLDRLCWKIVQTFPGRVRIIQNYGEDYLLRFYIKHNGILPGLYLHRFFRGDQDRELHNHPWLWSFSFVLTGGYVEERLTRTGVRFKERKPLRFNFLLGNTFHRVDLVNKQSGAWTLFCSGSEVKDWGFMLESGAFVPHKEYLDERDDT